MIRSSFVIALAFPASVFAQSSPVARLVVTPAVPTIAVGQTLQLKAEAMDSAGRAVPGATIRYQRSGGIFEGSVDQNGVVSAGAPGTLVLNVSAIVEGQRPFIRRLTIPIEAGPAATIEITPRPTKLLAGQTLPLRTVVRSANKDTRGGDRVVWSTSSASVARMSSDGTLTAVAPGRATITASSGAARETLAVEVVSANVRSIAITPAGSQVRTGDVVRFSATVTDASGRQIAGLTPTWLFAPGEGLIGADGGFVGYAPGTYTVTATFGQRSAATTATVVARDVRRSATVVGSVVRSAFSTSEVWVHPNGRVAYLGTLDGGRVYVIDVANPASPVVADSVMLNARVVNDVMTSEDGKVLVMTREGADNRRNGIAIYTLDDPLHPKFASEFTDPVTSGVHSAFVNTQAKYGRFAYITADGVGRLYILDLNDPANPKQVATWEVPRTDQGRYLHDIDVQDGILYASYLNDGLVILDVGNGMKGGSPQKPTLISQFKYDLVGRRKVAEAEGNPVIGGTHTAWRRGNYVFLGDEILPFGATNARGSKAPERAWGGLQVVDVSDIEHPKSVAWYEPEFGGVHNVWVAGDTLYMGAYNAGFRAFDVSGELRGDLRAQQRELTHVAPVDPGGKVPNASMTWGAVVKNGLVFVPDINNGLFIIRLDPKPPVVP
ncbi:MAG TPA: Ig-like domain-containing protein [Gemmatimonadaceae bacterium]|nr:Ig-like domain-containing protein [Gemmatimonadaceae bacterium]